jgi:hypothetical protein
MHGESPKNPRNLKFLKIHPANLIPLPIQEINYDSANILAQDVISANTIGFGEGEPRNPANNSQCFAYLSGHYLLFKLYQTETEKRKRHVQISKK